MKMTYAAWELLVGRTWDRWTRIQQRQKLRELELRNLVRKILDERGNFRVG